METRKLFREVLKPTATTMIHSRLHINVFMESRNELWCITSKLYTVENLGAIYPKKIKIRVLNCNNRKETKHHLLQKYKNIRGQTQKKIEKKRLNDWKF